MKVLVVINNLGVGGAERLVINDINEMLKRGFDVTLLTLKPEKEEKSLYDLCKLPDSKRILIDFGSLLNIKSWFSVVRTINSIKPDVVITHLWFSNTIGVLSSWICGVKNIFSFEQNVYDDLKTKKMFFVDRVIQKFASNVVAVSEAVKKSLIKHGIDERKIVVIHNSVNLSDYNSPKDGFDKIKKDLGINANFIYLYVGRLIDQKGVDILLEAFSGTKEGILLIAGDGPRKQDLKDLSKRLNIDSRVIFLGIRKDIPELLALCDCFVLVSRYEGLPLILLEAAASGKPVIVSNFESAKEIITNNIDGLVVPIGEVSQLTEAMDLIYKDDQLRDEFSKNIKLKSKYFSIENHIDKILKLLR